MNFEFRSNTVESHSLRQQPPGSPSLDSAVLSGSIIPSSAGALEASGDEWVLFSPQLSPVEELGPLDDTDLGDSAHTTSPRDANLELPGHDGDGSFRDSQTQGSRGGDWMERINSWRLEQSHLLFSEFQNSSEPRPGGDEGEEGGTIRFWRRLTRNAAHSIGKYLVWDDDVLDALFSPDFNSKDARPAPQRAPHLERACEFGPPGWEQRAISGALHEDLSGEHKGTLMVMLARILLWNYHSPTPPVSMGVQQHLDLLHESAIPSLSSAPSAYWSDGWEIGTNTSIGTAA